MLDFQKLIPQIQKLGQDSLKNQDKQVEVLSLAQNSFEEASQEEEKFKLKLLENGGRTFWPLAIPLEPFGYSEPIRSLESPYTIIACDGSQIMPTQHEVYSCYLLNVGLTIISYRSKEAPVLASIPKLFYRPEDLYPLIDQRRVHLNESVVSLERTLLELDTALQYAIEAKSRALPTVALVDGSLIPWNVDKMPDSYQKEYLSRLELILDSFNNEQIPLIGYVSHSRSSDIVNALRVWRCPYPESSCQAFCGHLNEEDFPCSKIWPLSDRQLLGSKLAIGSRNNVCLSEATWSRSFSPRNQIAFCYLHTGQEVARLELPRWLFEERESLRLSLSAVLSQTEKGNGYPISLSEAHNLAVIRQQDRSQFFELVAQQLVAAGVSRITVSPKESRKRQGIV